MDADVQERAHVGRLSWARVHRWLSVLLVVPLAVWSITGLVFHLKPGWARAYDQLAIERPTTLHPASLAPPPADVQSLELFDTVLGPLYRIDGARLVDARTGQPRVLSPDEARALAADAVARSAHPYGAAGAVTSDDATVHIAYGDGVRVDVSRADARISQRGSDTDRIDWLYRLHYLQWTGNRTLDRVIAVAGLVLIWMVFVPGLVLFVRRLRAAE